MKNLVDQYRACLPHQVDYTTLLVETNIFGRGKHLIPNEGARKKLASLFLEAEARLDLEMANRLESLRLTGTYLDPAGAGQGPMAN